MKVYKSKIIILAGFIIGLVFITIWLFDVNKGYEGRSISPDPFKPVAMSAISNKIEGKDYKTARNAFDSICQMIDVQDNLILKDGSRPTPKDQIDSLKLLAYNAAVKSLLDEAEKLYKSSKWSSFSLSEMKSQATYYRSLIPQDNFYEPNLAKVVNSINDYYAAMKMCRNAGATTTVAGIQWVEKQVKKYNEYPQNNDTELKKQLNSAVQKAKNSVSTHIAQRANNLKNEVTTFASKEDFLEKYNSINNSLSSYVTYYGNNSSTNSARTTLQDAYYEAEKYFYALSNS